MLRSAHWIGDVAGKTTLMVAAAGVVLLVGRLWLAAVIVLALVPVVAVAWLALFRRAEAHGRVAAAEERSRQDWQWFRDAGRLRRAGAVAVIVVAMLTVAVLNYLRWRWRLPPYGP